MDKLEFENFEVVVSVNQKQPDDDVQTSQEQAAIKFSSNVVAALEHKAKEHNSIFNSKSTVDQLKKVYRRGAESVCEGSAKGLCAMARVNMYLRMKEEGKITYQKPKAEIQAELKELVFENKRRIQVNTFIDITEDWLPIEADFVKAEEDIKTYKLDYDFKNIDELYLDDYQNINTIWS